MTVIMALLLVLRMMVTLTTMTTRMIQFFVPADRFGRKKALMLSLLIHVGCAIGTAFSPSFAVFVTLRFFVGLGNLGTFLTAYTLGENQGVSLFPTTPLPSSAPPFPLLVYPLYPFPFIRIPLQIIHIRFRSYLPFSAYPLSLPMPPPPPRVNAGQGRDGGRGYWFTAPKFRALHIYLGAMTDPWECAVRRER